MTILAELASLRPAAVVEMFEFDASNLGVAEPLFRWHPGTTVEGTSIVWQGNTYAPYPIFGEEFAVASSGTLPRPKFRTSNIGGALGQYLRSIGEGLGAKITRKRTLGKYLDAVNFPGGNPDADPSAHFPDEVYYVARRVAENAIEVQIEAAVAFDVQGVMLPRRQVIASTCSWKYRGVDCGYTGPPVQDIAGNPTSDPTKDRCRKTLSACRARFPSPLTLPTSAFPASLLLQ